MKPETDYQDINRQSWNDRVDAHLKSEFYNVDEFLKGKASLNDIESSLLGAIRCKSILHLQCHFGQDTLSLQRMGANCVGGDLSDKAIQAAQNLNEELGFDARFVTCDVYEAPKHINEMYDTVFTS